MGLFGRWLVAGLVVAAATAGGADAATITVSTIADETTPGDGSCSLREAVAAANLGASTTDCALSGTGPTTIVLSAHSYPLSILPSGIDDDRFGDLNATGTMTIDGGGHATITAQNASDRALDVAASAHVTLKGLTVTGGHARDGANGGMSTSSAQAGGIGLPGGDGGGIRSAGTLALDHVTVTGNHAGNGGLGGDGFEGGVMPGSSAGGPGGAGGQGGGLYSTGQLTVTDSTISANRAGDGGTGGRGGTDHSAGSGSAGGKGGQGHEDGGGVAVDVGGTATITGTTINNNISGSGGDGGPGGIGAPGGLGGSASWGGGLSAVTATVTVSNSTLAGNSSGDGGTGGTGGTGFGVPGGVGRSGGNGGGAGHGGAIRATSATVTLRHVTVAGNELGSPGQGGAGGSGSASNGSNGTAGLPGKGAGLYVEGIPTPLTLVNTIVSANPGGNCASGSPITDGGGNLRFGDASCPATIPTGDPQLGLLADNGGPTQTMSLEPGSAARDKIAATGAGCAGTDQRGVPRPGGPACDIGAYEIVAPSAQTGTATGVGPTTATLNGSITPNSATAEAYFEYGTTSALGTQSVVTKVGGVTAAPFSVTITSLTPNTTYHFAVVVASPDGVTTATDRTFTTPALIVVPRLSKLSIAPRKFRRGHRATISYSDSEASLTTFTVARVSSGVRKGKRCVAPPRRRRNGSHVKLKRCTRYVPVKGFSFRHTDHAGSNSLGFTGVIGRHKLAPGSYRLSLTAHAAGKTSRTLTITFVISPPPRRGVARHHSAD